MNGIEYIESEKLWRAPEFPENGLSLGEEILRNLKRKNPEKVYEILHDSNTHVTVKEVHDQTITVAQNLLKIGVQKNDVVVVLTNLNLKITPLTFACYTIGAPVCFFETNLQQEFVAQYFEYLDPTVIIYEEEFKPKVFEGINLLKLSKLKHLLSFDGKNDGQQKSVDETLFKPEVDIQNFEIPKIGDPKVVPAILAFTSGTTGLPKIAVHSHEVMKHSVYSLLRTKPGSVVMALSEIRWLCQVLAMMKPAFLDVRRVYSSTPPPQLTGEFACQIIDTQKVTHYIEVPRFFEVILNAAENNPLSLNSLELVSLGGESVPEVLKTNLAKLAPNCICGGGYGMTDIGVIVANCAFDWRKNVNGGILRNGSMVKIIDQEHNPLGPNELGEICIRTSAPFLGYLKNKKVNEEAFIDGGWLKTGDLGMMDSDNLLNVYTREKYALRYADGKVLLPNEIESVVEKFKGVDATALIGRLDRENSKEEYGTVFVVMKHNSNHKIDVENELAENLRRNLTPQQLKIVKYFKIVEELPRTACFKLDRLALKGMCDGSKQI